MKILENRKMFEEFKEKYKNILNPEKDKIEYKI